MNRSFLVSTKLHKGLVYEIYEGYPKFAFHKDLSGKTSILTIDKKCATSHIFDEVYGSVVPYTTWVSNYVVGKIGGEYYIVSSECVMHHKSRFPYVVFKNVFVQHDCVVNKRMQTIDYSGRDNFMGITTISRQCAYACYSSNSTVVDEQYIINSDGEEYRGFNFAKHPSALNTVEREYYVRIPKDGALIFDDDYNPAHLNNFWKMFKYNEGAAGVFVMLQVNKKRAYFSRKYGELEGWKKCDKFDVINEKRHDSLKATSLIVKPNGDTWRVDYIDLDNFEETNCGYVYRNGNTIIELDFEGKVISSEEMSLKELYYSILLEKIEKKLMS